MRLKETRTHDLRVDLTPSEVTDRAERLSWAMQRADEVAIEHAATKERLKKEREEVDGAVAELSKILREKAEKRPVECDLVLDDDAKEALLVRTDTGEVVSSRSMTEDELQSEIEATSAERHRRAVERWRRLKADRDHLRLVPDGEGDA